MKKAVFLLTIIMLVSLGALTGCSLFGGNDTNTQASNEEAPKKEVETEEKEKDTKDKKVEELKNNEESKKESNSENKEVNSNSNNGSDAKEGGSKTSESSSNSKSGGQENQVDWGSAWTRDIQFDHALLEITQKGGSTFSFKLHATNAMDAEAVKRGVVNVGEVTGTAKVDGDVATQTAPDPDTGCQIKMTNYTGYIQVEPVTDCSGPAGMRVHFDGKYKKGNIPEPEIAVEDNANDNFEPSEDEAQNNNGEATEEDSQISTDNESSTQTGDSNGDPSSQSNAQPISKEEARQLVVNYLHPDNPERIIEYDHDDNGDYIFHYYIVVDDPNIEDDGHTATFGWYGVNPNTKEVYDYMAAMD